MQDENTSEIRPLKVSEKTKTPGVRDFPKHTGNPFMTGTVVEVKGKKRRYNVATKADLIVTALGEVTGGIEHSVVKTVDDTKFVKVFLEGIRAIYELQPPGMKMFCYLFSQVQNKPNTDRYYLYFLEAFQNPHWKMPKTTFFLGLGELLDKGFIGKSELQHQFYLNPAMLWNGDRFTFINEYRREGAIQTTREANFIQSITEEIEYSKNSVRSAPDKLEAALQAGLQASLEAAGQQRLDV